MKFPFRDRILRLAAFVCLSVLALAPGSVRLSFYDPCGESVRLRVRYAFAILLESKGYAFWASHTQLTLRPDLYLCCQKSAAGHFYQIFSRDRRPVYRIREHDLRWRLSCELLERLGGAPPQQADLMDRDLLQLLQPA